MSLILPYDSELMESDGAFIKPDGKIVYPFEGHEGYARKYCIGQYFDALSKIRSDAYLGRHDEFCYSEEYWNELKKMFNYKGDKKDVDIYLSSSLNKEQLELYKKWIEEHEFLNNNLWSDFLVYVLGIDKVDTIRRRGITTTSRIPHVRFYNYYLMDWNIWVHNPKVLSEETGCFVSAPREFCTSLEEREAKEELDEIKAKTLKKDRIHFLK